MDALQKNPAHALLNYKKTNADDLADLLRKASDAYYHPSRSRGSGPIISDEVFDIALDHLRKIAPKHAFLDEVGAPLTDNKVKLPFWMGSLDKIKDDGEKIITKFLSEYPGDYVVSHKLDGNSGLLVFDGVKGTPKLYSRGNGTEGQDLTKMLDYIKLPKVSRSNYQSTLAIRGELIISKRNWAAMSDKGANARNVVAGALHAKTPDADIAKRIDFVVYELLEPKMSFSEGLAFLQELGFLVVDHQPFTRPEITIENLSKVLVRERESAAYEIDGIVVTHDDEHKIVKGKNPKHAFAFKSILTHEEAEVLVSGVEWRVSKDGYIKPTVVFPSVNLNGVNIQRATGNNASFIEKNGIGVGARIVIIRSGDVIPKVIRVTRAAKPMMPEIPYKWNDTHVDIMVESDTATPEQKLRNLEHFAKSLSIKNVAAGTLKKLVDAGNDNVGALLKLTVADVMKIDGFQKTSATKVVTALREVKKASCIDMMVASNIFGRGLGERKIKPIVKAFPQIMKGEAPTLSELKGIDGVGDVTGKAFLAGLSAFFVFMQDIGMPCRDTLAAPSSQSPPSAPSAPLKPQASPKASATFDFKGSVIVFTGFRNKEWEGKVEEAGGKVSTSISGKTTLVVAADPHDTSTKLKKARDLGIKIVSKEEFTSYL